MRPALILSSCALLAMLSASAPADAAVVCKRAGWPKGCVPASTVVFYCTSPGVPAGCVAAPARRVVYCTAPGVPAGCTAGTGAPGIGVRAGIPGNRGGPVNRVGIR